VKTIHYISGLPRTGSTLLTNILIQNPEFHATGTSGLPAIMEPLKNGWDDIDLHQQLSYSESRLRQRNVLGSVMQGYYQHIKEDVVFDKSRAWPTLAETLRWIQPDVKIIVTVRNVRQILESMEALYCKRLATGVPSQAKASNFGTMEARAQYYVGGGSLVGSAYEIVRDAVNRGNKDIMHFVRFEDLTADPEGTLEGIYEFLGHDNYKHDFDNVEQVIHEDDRQHGFDELHDIRTKVAPVKPRRALGTFGKEFEGQEFWDNFK
jgi:sulfotransferase